MIIGRIIGWIVALLGLLVFFNGMVVPAFIATSYLLGGALMVFGGAFMIFVFKDRKKAMEKKARQEAEIEKRKREILAEEKS